MLVSNPRLKGKVIGALVVFFILLLLLRNSQAIRSKYTNHGDDLNLAEAKPMIGNNMKADPSYEFWSKVFTIIKNNQPELTPEEIENAVQYIQVESYPSNRLTKDQLLAKAVVSDTAFKEFKLKHERLLKELPDELSQATYKKGSKGVVIIGGLKFSWLGYLSLKSLRATGSTLPVEIIMPTYKDYENEAHFCLRILPKLGARCVVVPDVFGPDVSLNWSFAKYQYKSLALMVSSFQHVILLDSDNVAVQDPEPIFNSEVYKKNGMITWPDYWPRVITPRFYDIAGVKVNENKRVRFSNFNLLVSKSTSSNLNDEEKNQVPFHDLEGALPDVSTESGQLVINKGTHGKTLLLSLYYNVCGPNLYYQLFSLGDPGEGDKDTFPAAALITNQPYYQINSGVRTFGYVDNLGKFQGVAIGQKDPIADYNYYEKKWFKTFKDDNQNSDINAQIQYIEKNKNVPVTERDDIPLFTVHCNYPKLDLETLMSRKDLYDIENNRLKYKFYGDYTYKRKVIQNGEKTTVDVNFELDIWQEIKTTLCDKKIKFAIYANADMDHVCSFLNNQVNWLSSLQ